MLNSGVVAFNISADENNVSSLLGIKSEEKGTFYIKTEIPKNYKTEEKNGKWGVRNKDDNSILVPFEYQKIEALGLDTLKVKKNGRWGVITNNNKVVLKTEFDDVSIMGFSDKFPKDIIHSMYLGKSGKNYYAVIAGRDSTDFFDMTIDQNNRISWLRFYDYPKKGVVVLNQGKKYGFITLKGEDIWIIMPQYEDYYVQDKASAIFQHFGISHSNPDSIIVKKGGKWGIVDEKGEVLLDFQYDSVAMLASAVDLSTHVHNDTVDFAYNKITFPEEDKIIVKKDGKTYLINRKGDVLSERLKEDNNLKYYFDDISKNFLTKLYQANNKNNFIKFYDYPSNGIYVTKNKNKYGLKIISDNNLKIIPAEYEDFKFQDSDTAIYKQLGVSFSPPDRIPAKKKGKWGVITYGNDIIVDFQFDEIMMLPANIESEADFNKNGVKIKYKKIKFPKSYISNNYTNASAGTSTDVMIVKKDKLYGLIDMDGDYIIQLQYEALDKKQLAKNIIKENNKKQNAYGDSNYFNDDTPSLSKSLVHTGGLWLSDSLQVVMTPFGFLIEYLPLLPLLPFYLYMSWLVDQDLLPRF